MKRGYIFLAILILSILIINLNNKYEIKASPENVKEIILLQTNPTPEEFEILNCGDDINEIPEKCYNGAAEKNDQCFRPSIGLKYNVGCINRLDTKFFGECPVGEDGISEDHYGIHEYPEDYGEKTEGVSGCCNEISSKIQNQDGNGWHIKTKPTPYINPISLDGYISSGFDGNWPDFDNDGNTKKPQVCCPVKNSDGSNAEYSKLKEIPLEWEMYPERYSELTPQKVC